MRADVMTAPDAPHLLAVLPDRLRPTVAPAILAAAGRAGIALSIASYLPREALAAGLAPDAWLPLPPEASPGAFDAFVAWAVALHRSTPIARVVAFAEQYVEAAARVNAMLGLGGITPDSATAARDKGVMRTRMHRAGIPVPPHAIVRSRDEFERAVARIGYPCVAKPARASASEGVVMLTAPAGLDAAFDECRSVEEVRLHGSAMLVEGYVAGPEYSVEAIALGGAAHVVGVTAKTTEDEPYFAEVMHVHPAPLPDGVRRAIATLATRVARALGLAEGGMHLELRLTPRGPVVMECAARLGGDSIPILVRLATGVDMYECVLRQAAGLPLPLAHTKARSCGIRFVQSPHEGTLVAAGFDAARLRRIGGVVAHGTLCAPGARIGRPPRGTTIRLAFALAVGGNAADVESRLHDAEHAFAYTLLEEALVC